MNPIERIRRHLWIYKLTKQFRVRNVKEGSSYTFNGLRALLYGERRYVLSNLMNIGPFDVYGLKHISDGDINTIVDIGANVGMFCFVARSYFPNARIIAYEPCSQTRQYLIANVGKLDVDIQSAAVGSANRRVPFLLQENLETCRVHESLAPGVTEEVQQVTFDDVLNHAGGPIDLLKLDCEGAEYDIMKSRSFGKLHFVAGELHLDSPNTPAIGRMLLLDHGFTISKWEESDTRSNVLFWAHKIADI